MTFSQNDLDNLKEALLSGADEVQIGDRRIKFKSKKELLELIELVENSIEGHLAKTENTKTIQASFSKQGKKRKE